MNTINGGTVWSRSRRRAWNQCRRRYLLKYHGDQAEREACRKLASEHQWAVQILFDGINQAITAAGPPIRSLDPKALIRQADRRITAQWSRARKGEPLLAICANEPDNPGLYAIPKRVREKVSPWFHRFAESAVLQHLLATPPARRRPPAQQRIIEVGEVAAAPAPLWGRLDTDGLAFSVWSITAQPPADAAEWATAALFACHQTRHRTGSHPL